MSANADAAASGLPEIAPPPLRLLLAEVRAISEWAQFALSPRVRRQLPAGDGHAVLLIPGFGTSDAAMQPLRRALQDLGYAAHGWNQGRNFGMRTGLKQRLSARMESLHATHGGLSLIGWSLGGVIAREMARAQPQLVRRVITLGSPISGRPDANNVHLLYQRMNPRKAVTLDVEGFRRRCVAPPVRCTAIHSKSDGIVAWQCSQEVPGERTENLEVRGSHCGLGFNLEVLRLIAERLAQPA